MAERRFSEKETALIPRNAALIQAEAAQERDAPLSGYSLSELEVAAKDVGMNPELLRQAIAELGLCGEPASTGHAGPLRSFFGSPWSYRVGAPLDALPDRETLENLLSRMNDICRTAGAGGIGIGLGLGVPLLFTKAMHFIGPAVIVDSIGASYLLSRSLFGRQSRTCDAVTRRIAQEIRYFIAKRP
jgi:hypothetical protein